MELLTNFITMGKIDQYEKVLGNLPIGITVYNEYGNCYFTTNKTVEILGAKNTTELLNQNFHEIQSWKTSGIYNYALKSFENLESNITVTNIITSFNKNLWLKLIFLGYENVGKRNLLLLIINISHLKEKEEYYQKISYFDSLTELNNRRFFDDELDKIILNSRDNKRFISLLFIDIDYFKYINDTYGHLVGDHCLKSIGKVIKDITLKVDGFSARYGGEEFVVVLKSSNEISAHKIAIDIKSAIDALKIPNKNSPIGEYLTISIGVSTQFSDDSLEKNDLIYCADMALYSAKKNGRNKIEISDQKKCL